MEFLYFLEKIRLPGLNEFMLAVTYLGDEIAFLVIALIVFWCVNKRLGYYVLSVGFVGTIMNQFMKLQFRVPRPWVLDEKFSILEQAREAAAGYSFPSGHTQSSVGVFGGLAYTTKNKTIRWVCIAVAILVPFSRMYIGVHTPLDVFVAAAMAVALILILKPVIMEPRQKDTMPWVLAVMGIIGVMFLLFVELYPFPADIDEHNMQSGLKNAYTMVGCILGFIFVYIVDEKWLHFPVKACWWAQILKVAIGLCLVLVVKSGAKTILDGLFGALLGRSVRYFLIVIVAGILWPMTFHRFEKLGSKE